METVFNEINATRLVLTAYAQAAVSGEIPMPEGRTVKKVLFPSGEVIIKSCETQKDKVSAEGEIILKLLCLDEDGEVFTMNSVAPFQHTLDAQGAKPGMCCELFASLVDISVEKSVNALTMSSMVDIYSMITDSSPLKCPSCENAGLEHCELEFSCKRLEFLAQEDVLLREEIVVSNVKSICYATGSITLKSISTDKDSAGINGILNIDALILDNDNRLSRVYQGLPFFAAVELDEPVFSELFAKLRVKSLKLQPLGGEFGLVGVEADTQILLYTLVSETASIMTDAYSPELELEGASIPVSLINYSGDIEQGMSFRESLTLDDGEPEIAEALYAFVRPVVTGYAGEDGRLAINGVCFTHSIYRDESDSLNVHNEAVPFRIESTAAFLSETVSGEISALRPELRGNGKNLELSCTLMFLGQQYNVTTVQCVTDMRHTSPPQMRRGITVYFAEGDESVFEIGKRFMLPKNAITMRDDGKVILVSR